MTSNSTRYSVMPLAWWERRFPRFTRWLWRHRSWDGVVGPTNRLVVGMFAAILGLTVIAIILKGLLI